MYGDREKEEIGEKTVHTGVSRFVKRVICKKEEKEKRKKRKEKKTSLHKAKEE